MSTQVGYRLRRLPQRRALVRNLLFTILQLLKKSQRPMSSIEIISALSRQYQRSDPEFQRQVRLNLQDAVGYGILRRQSDIFSLRSKRFVEIMKELAR
ncbi:hypothetical protein KR093_004198 [Drosophila rubida]|uniref:DUF4777 domain-containing protein n=1 Tax=Drosophila rubida TaxID=30044 RepID=A0AAD4KCT7_9MUSC|nr:hypothetical protein KR093_004198 [Drosophila rubida]